MVFHLGQLIEVVEGPFASFRGEIELIKTAAIDGVDVPVRLTAAINIFGRLTPAEFDLFQVEPVDIAATPCATWAAVPVDFAYRSSKKPRARRGAFCI